MLLVNYSNMMARSLEFNYSITLPVSLIVENATELELLANTTKPTPFVNPFSKLSVRAIFSTAYALVFTLCLLGKYM